MHIYYNVLLFFLPPFYTYTKDLNHLHLKFPTMFSYVKIDVLIFKEVFAYLKIEPTLKRSFF